MTSIRLTWQGWIGGQPLQQHLQHSVAKTVEVGAIIRLHHFHNLSFPQFTYDQVAYPDISLQNGANESKITNATSMLVHTSALRVKLICYNIPSSDAFFNFDLDPSNSGAGYDVWNYTGFKVLE